MKSSKLLLTVLFAILIASCKETPSPPPPSPPPPPTLDTLATSITISPRLMHIDIGETQNLIVTVKPADYDYQAKIDWQSGNTLVATVVNGAVTGVSNGETIITATLDTVSASCSVICP